MQLLHVQNMVCRKYCSRLEQLKRLVNGEKEQIKKSNLHEKENTFSNVRCTVGEFRRKVADLVVDRLHCIFISYNHRHHCIFQPFPSKCIITLSQHPLSLHNWIICNLLERFCLHKGPFHVQTNRREKLPSYPLIIR